jgi:hypothetical protein
MRGVVRLLAIVALCAFALEAQPGRRETCELVLDELPNASWWQVKDQYSGSSSLWISGGVRGRCLGTTMVVTADSAEYFGASQILILIGNARYREDGTTLTADVIRYYEPDARLEAQGRVRLRTESGTTLTADQIIHLRDLVGVRQSSSLVLGRPRAVLRDSASVPDSLATRVDAERMYAQGDSLLYAGGAVVITRADLITHSDSAEAISPRETLRLLGGTPTMEALGEQAFTLTGRLIDVFGATRQVERVLARGEAVAVSDSLSLSGDTILIGLAAGALERVRAWGPPRSRAVTGGRDITADSLDIKLPGQRIEELIAIGTARAETAPDSALQTDDLDWLAGDTIRAMFEPPPGADSTGAQPVLRTLEARGTARSFYQLSSSDAEERRPAINYVVGTRIDVRLVNGEVQVVHVNEQARGIYLEPSKAVAAPPPSPRRGGGDR